MQHHSVSMSIHVTVPRNNINQTNRNPAFMSVHDLKTHKSTHAHVYILPTGQYWADIWFGGSLTTLAVNVFTETACLHYCRAHASPMKEQCLEVFFQQGNCRLFMPNASMVMLPLCGNAIALTVIYKSDKCDKSEEKKQVQCKLSCDWQGDCHMCSGQTNTKLHTKPPSQAMQWSWGGLKTKSITRTSVREEERED